MPPCGCLPACPYESCAQDDERQDKNGTGFQTLFPKENNNRAGNESKQRAEVGEAKGKPGADAAQVLPY